jgi:hypothetical protein
MGYARSFRQLRTHVLCSAPVSGELSHDRALVYDALREGRCYIAVDELAPARGFAFWGEGAALVAMGAEAPARGGWTLRARFPRPAELRLFRDGSEIAVVHGAALDFDVDRPGVYRVEAHLPYRGRQLTWIVSNPLYLREEAARPAP